MADQNTSCTEPNFCSEVLTPAQLFAARTRSHKIPVRGQKDFIPDGSEEQRLRLEQSLKEHWSLLSEERVERLGSLVKGVWIPDEKIVELQSPAGKFWQTMGFSARGKQCLLPEEALFLMECGNVQVYYQELPLSIQDGYERFLTSNSISFHQYLVYGHLKRLGYVVHRFDSSLELSLYARQLNLPVSRDKVRQLKRKRSPSPSTLISQNKSLSRAECTVERIEKASGSCEGGKSHLEIYATISQTKAEEDSTVEQMEEELCCKQETAPHPSNRDEPKPRSWWTRSEEDDNSSVKSGYRCIASRWDFSSIYFPDVGSGSASEYSVSTAPDPSLLPGALTVGPCDVAPWRQRINLKEVKRSPKEQKYEEDINSYRVDINLEVQRCRNWSEYRELMSKCETRQKGRPAHLWDREVTPLHDPTLNISHEELLEKISIIKSTNLLEGASRLQLPDEWRISFSVYQPDAVGSFKKSSPGRPYVRMVVCSFDGPVPDLNVLKWLSSQSPDAPLVFAAVDHGDISFYTFKDFHLPRDIFP